MARTPAAKSRAAVTRGRHARGPVIIEASVDGSKYAELLYE